MRPSFTDCGNGFTPPTTDQLILTVTDAPIAGGTVGSITVSGVTYNVGSAAGVGFATLLWADDVPPTDSTDAPSGTGDSGPTGASPSGTYPGTAGDETLVTGTNCPDQAPNDTTCGISNAYITNLKVEFAAANAIKPGQNRNVGAIDMTETNFESTTPNSDSHAGTAADPHQNGVCIQPTDTVVHCRTRSVTVAPIAPGTTTDTAGR